MSRWYGIYRLCCAQSPSVFRLFSVFPFLSLRVCSFSFFFLNDPAPPEFSPLPLPAALPIWELVPEGRRVGNLHEQEVRLGRREGVPALPQPRRDERALFEDEASGPLPVLPVLERDRKSTRLNSSHLVISYAVFCLKKKHIYS